MASITLATTAVPGDGATFAPGNSAGALVQGKFAYKNTSKKFDTAQANASATAPVVGMITESVGALNTPCQVQTGGVVNGISGLTAGVIYVLSDTVAGAIMPVADLTTGDQITIIGYALSATSLKLLITPTGLTAA